MVKKNELEKAEGKLHWSDTDLLNIQTEADALALLQEVGYTVEEADKAIGNGFAILPTDHKGRLEGLPLLFLSWRFSCGDMGEFVSALVLAPTQNGVEKWILNDGSTGIYNQLKAYSENTGRYGGLRVKRGLRRSDYTYTDPQTGNEKPATTFYLDTSA